jgi:very-short-patch-repair endonuclease
MHRLHKRVFALGRAEVTTRGRFRAAVLAIDGSVLSHRSAAALWGFMADLEGPVDVTVERKARSRRGIRVHETSRFPARDLQRRAGIPLTEPHRTLLDLADVLSRRDLRRALGQAEVMRLVAHPRLRDLLADAHGRHGAHTLSGLLDRGPAPTRSPLEDDLVDFLHHHGLGPRQHNARVAGYEVDVLFPAQRLVIEADSRTYHDTPTARADDAEKDDALRAAGCQVLRLRKIHLNDRTARRIRTLLLPGPTDTA